MLYESKEFTLSNGKKLVLKSPSVDEAEELKECVARIAGQTPFLLSGPEDFERITLKREERWIESYAGGKSYLIAAYVDGKIVGNCNLDFNSRAKMRHRCTLGIAIDENYCNMGIGSILLDEMIRLARETEGVTQMELDVFKDNARAIHLYQKKGFVETGVIPRAALQSDGSYADELIMTKFLD